jgi:hypothetical protein
MVVRKISVVQAHIREITVEIDQQELWNTAVLPTIP